MKILVKKMSSFGVLKFEMILGAIIMAAAMILLLSATKPFQCYHVSVYYTIRSGGQILQTMLFDSGFLWIVVAPITFLMCHFVHLPFPAVYGLCLLPEVLKAIFGKFLLRKDSWIKKADA